MNRVTIYCIFQHRKYRFTAPENINLVELESRIRKRLNVPECFELQRVNGSESPDYPEEGDTFEFKDFSDEIFDVLNMAVIYGPPSVFGLDDTDDSEPWV